MPEIELQETVVVGDKTHFAGVAFVSDDEAKAIKEAQKQGSMEQVALTEDQHSDESGDRTESKSKKK